MDMDMDASGVYASGLACSSCLVSPETVQVMHSLFGISGNIMNLLLYITPLITFKRIIRNKSTEDFSVVPYAAALLNCVIYTLYGSPLASDGWENIYLVTVNGTGMVMEITFIAIYFWFATPSKKVNVSLIMVPVTGFCCAMVLMSIFLPDHHLRKTILGSFGFIASASMYGSPLVAMKRVLETKSVEYMPLNLSLFSFLTSFSWMVYGLLGNDILLASPSFIGVPLGIMQLLVYAIYKKNKGKSKESHIVDFEKNEQPDLTSPLVVKNEEN